VVVELPVGELGCRRGGWRAVPRAPLSWR